MRDSGRPADERQQARRHFLTSALAAWGILLLTPVVKVIVEYLTPIRRTDAYREVIRVGSTNDLPINSARIFKVNKEPVIVVHTKSGQYKAFNARCTHLGCVVQYLPEEEVPHFGCNCHGSEFDLNGRNIAGPAPRPLQPYKVIIKADNLFVART